MTPLEMNRFLAEKVTEAWLIECEPPLGDVLYYCNDGDWCNNPNHAHKFMTADEANMKRVTMHLGGEKYRVCLHEWGDDK